MTNMADLSLPSSRDFVRKPVSALLWWGAPIALGVAAQPLGLPYRGVASVWALSFAWMAAGCVLNAVRCHRLHCYISGPAFIAGAIAAAAVAAGAFRSEAHALNYAIAGTFALVCASFLPEMFGRKYL